MYFPATERTNSHAMHQHTIFHIPTQKYTHVLTLTRVYSSCSQIYVSMEQFERV